MNQFYLLHFNVLSNVHHHNIGLICVPTDKKSCWIEWKNGKKYDEVLWIRESWVSRVFERSGV